MHYYKFINLLQKYSVINNLIPDFDKLEFLDNIYCISLSGGVDSMVLMDLLIKREKQIVAIHINYNNREETNLEEEFLQNYCEVRNITFISYSFELKRGSIKRSEYESYTKQKRFEIYKEVLDKYKLKYILLGHHKDDIVENIFSNFCRGDNFLNLSVIKEFSVMMDVHICRPLLNYNKQDIYDYSHYHNIPYFLDTTPDWSIRGKFRKNILPLLGDTFVGFKTNLLSIANQSDEWGLFIQTNIINKYLDLITYNYENDNLIIEMPIENYHDYPFCFWHMILSKVFHKKSISAPSRKSIEIFHNCLKEKKCGKILLKHGIELIIEKLKLKLKIKI
jgi:tRNA(Ile)-lysidine synthetase-like protein